jgi:hypothetical protein
MIKIGRALIWMGIGLIFGLGISGLPASSAHAECGTWLAYDQYMQCRALELQQQQLWEQQRQNDSLDHRPC